MDEPTVVVLGLPGFRLLEVNELDGELEYLVETTETVVGCHRCGTIARPKDRREVVLRDLAHADRPVRIRWRKRVWRCADPDCATKTWTEASWLAEPRRHLTNRARTEICRRVGQENASVALCARNFGVGWHAAWAAVTDVGTPLADDPERVAGVRAVGLDETMYRHARRGRRRVLVTGVVDVDTGRLLDVFVGRHAADLRQWMARMPPDWLAAIEVVSVDPHEGYRSAVVGADPVTGARSPWSEATIVVDPFHMVRLGNQAVTRCRQRVQQAVVGHYAGDAVKAGPVSLIPRHSPAAGGDRRRSSVARPVPCWRRPVAGVRGWA